MSNNYLYQIFGNLTKRGIRCKHLPADIRGSLERIVVSLTNDKNGKERNVILSLRDYSQPHVGKRRAQSKYFLRYFLELPLDIEEDRLAPLYQTCCNVNQSLDLQGFVFDGESLYFRYDLYFPKENSDQLIVDILGLIYFYADTYGPLFHEIASEPNSQFKAEVQRASSA